MTQNEINEALRKHRLWLKNRYEGERLTLRWADLHEADLQGADLRKADLRKANLRKADLRGAELDYSAWPLWCGSLDVKVDVRIARQIAYHFCRLDCSDPEYLRARNLLIDFANGFHRVNECGELKKSEEG